MPNIGGVVLVDTPALGSWLARGTCGSAGPKARDAMEVVRVIGTLEPGGAQLSGLRLSHALRRHGIIARCLLAGEATETGPEPGPAIRCAGVRLLAAGWLSVGSRGAVRRGVPRPRRGLQPRAFGELAATSRGSLVVTNAWNELLVGGIVRSPSYAGRGPWNERGNLANERFSLMRTCQTDFW